MNNKGFAITTILFGIALLFCLLLMSLLGTMSTYRHNMELLVDGVNGDTGARNLVLKREIRKAGNSNFANEEEVKNYINSYGNPDAGQTVKLYDLSGLYCYGSTCKYFSSTGNTGES